MTVLVPALTIAAHRQVHRVRELPLPGKIHCEVGAKVRAEQIVASAELPGDVEIIRLAERLGLEPSEALEALKVSVGATVHTGDILCDHRAFFGLIRSVLKSPCDGTVEFISEKTAHLGIRLKSKLIERAAYIDGVVRNVAPGHSVTIESSAAFVQGIFGIGGERYGVLTPLACAPDEEIHPRHIPADCSGMILFGGKNPTEESLKTAQSRGARGFVCGSIDAIVLRGFVGRDIGVAVTGDEPVSMSLIITEGFGAIPISPRVLELLKKFTGRSVSINGTTQVRAGAVRPEIIVQRDDISSEQAQAISEQGLVVGACVRMIRYPFFGMLARVRELPHLLQRIETGAESRVLVAELQDGKVVTVPRANVELYES